MDDFKDTMKRLLLEAENLLEVLEGDEDSNLRWSEEKSTLEETLAEARNLLWPKQEKL